MDIFTIILYPEPNPDPVAILISDLDPAPLRQIISNRVDPNAPQHKVRCFVIYWLYWAFVDFFSIHLLILVLLKFFSLRACFSVTLY